MNYEQPKLKEYLSILGIALGGNSTCLGMGADEDGSIKNSKLCKTNPISEGKNEHKLLFDKGL